MYGVLVDADDDGDDEEATKDSSEIAIHLIERRREEEEALLAIYGEDEVTVVREGCVQLRVSPTRPWALGAQPCVLLTVRLGSKYPEEAVEGIDIETIAQSGRVPGTTMKRLREKLRSRANELCGEVAVHELAVIVAETLDSLEASDLQQSMLQREAAEREKDAAQLERDQIVRAAEIEAKRQKAEQTVATQERRAGRLIVSPQLTGKKIAVSGDSIEENVDSSSSDETTSDDASWNESTDEESSSELESRYTSDFKELEVLGRGGFGEVTRCVNRLDKREYAVKRVRLAASASRRDAARQLREVEALASVFHPNIVRYYQSWIESYGTAATNDKDSDDDSLLQQQEQQLNGPLMMMQSSGTHDKASSRQITGLALYIQMEYAATTLRALIDQHALDGRPDDYWRLMRQMLEALAYLHGQDLVHRDIKPANIFIDSNGNAKIGDLGLATTVARAKKEKHEPENIPNTPTDGSEQLLSSRSLTWGVGTGLYRAPEVTSGKRRYDGAADVYSLGIVFYEMTQPPFDTGMERVEALQALRRVEPIWRFSSDGGSDEHAIRLVPRLVARRPEQRPTAQALLEGKEPGLLPAAADALDETQALLLARAKATIRDPFARARSQLITAIFDSQTVELLEFTYGKSQINTDWNSDDIFKGLRSISSWAMRFRVLAETHGAIELVAPLLRPRSSTDGESQISNMNAVELLDSDGTVVVLPNELTTPFARFLAMSISRSKKKKNQANPGDTFRRYELGRVYSKNNTPTLQAAYDVVRFDNGPTRTLEAECLSLGLVWSRQSHTIELHLEHAELPSNLAALRLLDTDLDRRLGGGPKRRSSNTLFPLERLAMAVDKVRRANDEVRDKPRRYVASALSQLRQLMTCVPSFEGPVLVDTAPASKLKAERMSPFGQLGIAFSIFCKAPKPNKAMRIRSTSANSDELETQVFNDADDLQLLCIGGRYEVTRFLSPRDRGLIGVRCVGLRFLYRTLSTPIEQPLLCKKRGLRVVVCGDGTDAADDGALAVAAKLRHCAAIDSAEHAPRFVHKGRTPTVDDIVASSKRRGCNAVLLLIKGRCIVRIDAKRYEVQDPEKFFLEEAVTLPSIGDETDDHSGGGFSNDATISTNTLSSVSISSKRIRFIDLTLASGLSTAPGNSSSSKGSRHSNKHKANAEATKRRAGRALTNILGGPIELIDVATTGIDTLCIALDVPLVALRRATSAVLAKQPLTGDRRGVLRAYADYLREQRIGTHVWGFSTVDNALDLAVMQS